MHNISNFEKVVHKPGQVQQSTSVLQPDDFTFQITISVTK